MAFGMALKPQSMCNKEITMIDTQLFNTGHTITLI
jgi:hypothetical protein